MSKIKEFFGMAGDENLSEQPPQKKPSQNHSSLITKFKQNSANMSEIFTFAPQKYSDVMQIAESYKENIPVIINLSDMTENDIRRLIDFISGLCKGLDGHLEKVTKNVLLLSPKDVAISSSVSNETDNDLEDFADNLI